MNTSKSFISIQTTCILLFSIITISYSARTRPNLTHKTQTQTQTYEPTLTFLIQDILTKTPSNQPTQTPLPINNLQTLPFSKPLVNLPIQTSPYYTSPSTQTLSVTFPSTTALHRELEVGPVTNIDEYMFEDKGMFGVQSVGKAQGIYVGIDLHDETTSNGRSFSHMVALTTTFTSKFDGENNEDDHDVDSLRFFGVHERDVLECHVAVIGGTGRFEDANGFATIRVVNSTNYAYQGSNDVEDVSQVAKLLFNVYLS